MLRVKGMIFPTVLLGLVLGGLAWIWPVKFGLSGENNRLEVQHPLVSPEEFIPVSGQYELHMNLKKQDYPLAISNQATRITPEQRIEIFKMVFGDDVEAFGSRRSFQLARSESPSTEGNINTYAWSSAHLISWRWVEEKHYFKSFIDGYKNDLNHFRFEELKTETGAVLVFSTQLVRQNMRQESLMFVPDMPSGVAYSCPSFHYPTRNYSQTFPIQEGIYVWKTPSVETRDAENLFFLEIKPLK